MADIKYYDVIKKPVITEKSMNAMAEKKYTFLVHPEANKSQIKEAVEKMFEGTKVKSVNTMNMDGKKKRRGMTVGTTAKTKKAIVALTEDSKDIEIFEGLLIDSPCGTSATSETLLLMNPRHSDYREYTHSKA